MQIAGNECQSCRRNVVFATEGKTCERCRLVFHQTCQGDKCPHCGNVLEPFHAAISNPLYNALDPRESRSSNAVGPLLVILCATVFLLIVVYLALRA